LGRAPTSPLSLIVEYPIEHDPLDGLDAAQRALQRPDLWQLSLNEEFLRRRRAVQKAEIYPSLSLAASYGYVTRRLPELTHLGHDFWSASMSVSLPLFDGLSTRGQVKETEALIRRAQHERMDAQRRAQAEVMQTLGELEAARANLTSSELNMQLAEAAMEQTTLRYRLGKGDYLSVLNAQTDRYQARSNLILARFEVLTGTAKLKRALGASPTAPLSSVLAAVPSQAVESEQ
jgi:outer membrane protein TolC